MLESSLRVLVVVLLAGCCTNDTSFYGRVRQANDANVQRALGPSLTFVPSVEDVNGARRDSQGNTTDGSGNPVMVLDGAVYTGGAARDSAGVLHPIQVHPRARSTESHHACDCEPHGGTPRLIPAVYVPLGSGSVGAPIDLDVDELVELDVTRSRCGGPPRP